MLARAQFSVMPPTKSCLRSLISACSGLGTSAAEVRDQILTRRWATCSGTWSSFSSTCKCKAETYFEYERDQACDSSRTVEKEASLSHALCQLEAAGILDKESRLWLPRFFGSRFVPVISTGSLKLDVALGIGGLPKGRIVEIFGKEASGKTTVALHIIKEAQKYGGYCAYIDAENGLDPSILDNMGIDVKKLLFSRPTCAENIIFTIDILAKSRAIDVIVVDSVAALLPQSEIDNVISADSENMQSQFLRRALRKIHLSLGQSQTLVIFLNQVRFSGFSKTNMHINEVSCGGNSLKFYSAVRLRIARSGLLQTEDEVSGIIVSVEVVKNKLAPAMKKAELNIKFGSGICYESEVLELASYYRDIVRKDGNGYWIGNKYLGPTEAEKYLVENHVLKNKLVEFLRTELLGLR